MFGDEAHETHGFVAADQEGRLGGIAHVRRFARPLSATTGLYLDDDVAKQTPWVTSDIAS